MLLDPGQAVAGTYEIEKFIVGCDGTGLRAKLSDFGLAKRVNPLTLMASACGTPAFKPPEVFRRRGSDSRAAGVFALGTTLYVLLTDELPYPDATSCRASGHVLTRRHGHRARCSIQGSTRRSTRSS